MTDNHVFLATLAGAMLVFGLLAFVIALWDLGNPSRGRAVAIRAALVVAVACFAVLTVLVLF